MTTTAQQIAALQASVTTLQKSGTVDEATIKTLTSEINALMAAETADENAMKALAARVSAIEADLSPTPPPPPPPPPVLTTSPDGTAITMPGQAVVDKGLHTFALVAGNRGSDVPAVQIAYDGVTDVTTGAVVEGLITNGGVFYQKNSAGAWYTGAPGTWTQVSDPTVVTPPVPTTRAFYLGIKPGGGGDDPYSPGSNDTAEWNADQTAIGCPLEAAQVYCFPGYSVQGAGFGQYGKSVAYMVSFWASNASAVVKNTDVIAGVYDTNIQGQLDQLAKDHAAGYNIAMIRPGWEVSHAANWFDWHPDNGTGRPAGTGNNAVNYVGAYRHIAAMIRKTCPWVLLCWDGPYVTSAGGKPGDDSDFYPGDDLVDAVTVDIYVQPQYQSGMDPGTPAGWTTLLNGYPGFAGLNAYEAYCAKTSGANAPAGQTGGRKWLGFPEIGGGGFGQAGAYDPGKFVANFMQWLQARALKVTHFLWWDGNDDGSTALGPAPGSPSGAAAFAAAQKATTLTPVWLGKPGTSPPA